MRRSLFRLTRKVALLLATTGAFASITHAKVEELDVAGASAKNLTAGTPIFYGGTAGVTGAHAGERGTFSTCGYNAAAPLKACNNFAITGNSQVTISFKVAKAGYPAVFRMDTTTTGTQMVAGGLAQIGERVYLTFLWSDICGNFPVSQTVRPENDCTFPNPEAGAPYMDLKVGLLEASGNTTFMSGEEQTVRVQVSSFIGQTTQEGESTTKDCNDANARGVCHYEIRNGDAKVTLNNLKHDSVPTGTNLSFQKLRLIWTEAASDSDQAAFDSINSSTPTKQDLIISTNAANEVVTSPQRIEGFENDKYYAFKVAMVDVAGNVGYYTDDTAFGYCEFAQVAVTTGGKCQFGHPGEVVGVLSADLNCFVATAAFGSALAPQVETLRQFRDRFLKPSLWGARFVEYYYQQGPKYARMIAKSEALRTIARGALWPAVGFAWLSLKFGMTTALLSSALLLAASVGAVLLGARSFSNRRARRG